MIVIQNRTGNVDTLLGMYAAVMSSPEVTIRGSKCKNVHDMAIVMGTDTPPLTSFEARKFSLPYAKREWLWYLKADKFDDSIQEHAKMWAKLKQPDGSFFSNYGQYMFSDTNPDLFNQFSFVADTLCEDKYSRRASMVLLKQDHLFRDNADVVCTYAINFTIVCDHLHMTVMMRSNDVIFGFTNDSFCFFNLYLLMYSVMKQAYPGLMRGNYTHFTNSMHVYERHYGMINEIVTLGRRGYTKIEIPEPTARETFGLIKLREVSNEYAYSAWLST